MTMHLFMISEEVQAPIPAKGMFTLAHEPATSDYQSYTAIRAYFQEHTVDEQAWYGFFLPSFSQESGLSEDDIHAFIAMHPECDVYAFSPFVKDAAVFLNVFEEGDFHEAGMLALAQAYLDQIGFSLDVATWVTQTDTNTRINYLVAKPAFWTVWFDLAEKLYTLSEETSTPFSIAANAYASNVPYAMKSLLIDRLASVVLALDPELTLAVYDAFKMPALSDISPADKECLHALSTLKAAYITHADAHRLTQFFDIRNHLLTEGSDMSMLSVDAPVLSNTDIATDQTLFYGCITHVPLPIAFPDYVTPIYLGTSQGPGQLNLRELAPQWVPYHPIIGGMAGNFALKNYVLQHYPNVQRIGVCMYRKFISRERISGKAAEDNWMMDVISDADLNKLPIAQMMAPGDAPFLIGQSCGFQVNGQEAGYLLHYLHAHHGEDLLRFTAAAVELGVLDKTEIDIFFNEKVFLIGGIELGVFPAEFWLTTVSDIEKIIWHCVQNFPVVREGYQQRSWAFCAERLGSYLVLRYINTFYRDQGGHQHFAGQLNLITQHEAVRYVPSH